MSNRFIPSTPAFLAGLFSIACAAAAAGSDAPAGAPVALPELVVSATRTPQDPQFTPSSVTALPLDALSGAQVTDLRTALAGVPGVNIVSSGATGGQSSVFIRGAGSTQTLFVVDGIPMNDRSANYNNFLGTADLAGLDRLEVLRGPQGTLYGSSAMGGVIFLQTAHGCGDPSGVVSVTNGTYDTLGASAAVQGGTANFGYSASLAREHTDNATPHNGYDQWSYSTRLEGKPTASLLLGATLRGQQGDYEDNGGRFYTASAIAADNHLVTAYAQWSADKDFVSRLTAGQQQRRYTAVGAWSTDEIRNRRNVLDWQNTCHALGNAEFVLGGTLEHDEQGKNGEPTSANNRAAYLSTTVHPVQEVTLDAGLRYDDFDTFGNAWTWHTGASWLPRPGTKLRATIGTGFCAPSTDDINGVPAWGWMANPDLKAEKSTGWDVGLDQDLFGRILTAGVTYFKTNYRDRLDYVSDPVTWVGRTENLTRSTSQGVETALTLKLWEGRARGRLAYTYLDARDDTENTRLLRQPRHLFDGELSAKPLAAWTVGAGLHIVADRWDNRVTEPAGPIEDYTTARFFTSYEVTKSLLLKVRVDNALNEKYEEAYGYAALPRRVLGGVEWRF